MRRELHGPSCEFAAGARPIFAGTASGLPALDQDRLLSPRLPETVLGCPGSWAAPFAPSSRKQAALDGIFFLSRLFFEYKQLLQTVCVGPSTGVQFWYYFLRSKHLASFFPLVLIVEDPTPRAHCLFVSPLATIAVRGRVLSLISLVVAPAFPFNRLSPTRPPRHARGPWEGFGGGFALS